MIVDAGCVHFTSVKLSTLNQSILKFNWLIKISEDFFFEKSRFCFFVRTNKQTPKGVCLLRSNWFLVISRLAETKFIDTSWSKYRKFWSLNFSDWNQNFEPTDLFRRLILHFTAFETAVIDVSSDTTFYSYFISHTIFCFYGRSKTVHLCVCVFFNQNNSLQLVKWQRKLRPMHGNFQDRNISNFVIHSCI